MDTTTLIRNVRQADQAGSYDGPVCERQPSGSYYVRHRGLTFVTATEAEAETLAGDLSAGAVIHVRDYR